MRARTLRATARCERGEADESVRADLESKADVERWRFESQRPEPEKQKESAIRYWKRQHVRVGTRASGERAVG